MGILVRLLYVSMGQLTCSLLPARSPCCFTSPKGPKDPGRSRVSLPTAKTLRGAAGRRREKVETAEKQFGCSWRLPWPGATGIINP